MFRKIALRTKRATAAVGKIIVKSCDGGRENKSNKNHDMMKDNWSKESDNELLMELFEQATKTYEKQQEVRALLLKYDELKYISKEGIEAGAFIAVAATAGKSCLVLPAREKRPAQFQDIDLSHGQAQLLAQVMRQLCEHEIDAAWGDHRISKITGFSETAAWGMVNMVDDASEQGEVVVMEDEEASASLPQGPWYVSTWTSISLQQQTESLEQIFAILSRREAYIGSIVLRN